jgi:hypothetical protein
MSLNPRLAGHGVQMGPIRFINVVNEPPITGDPVIYRKGDKLFLIDAAGITHPLVVGADGAGVVVVTAEMSPYAIQDTDRVLLVDTTAGPVVAELPADGGPFLGRKLLVLDAKRNFAVNDFTLDGVGNNINGGATLVLRRTDAAVEVCWADPTWEIVASTAGSSAPVATDAGTATLIAGVATISNVTLTASSTIELTRKTPAGSGLGHLAAPDADRTNGLGTGSFKIRAYKADATEETGDLSTVGYVVYG